MSDDQNAKTRARLAELENGHFWPGVAADVNPEVPPPWYEPETFRHAQNLAKDYLAIIGNSQLYGLVLILCFPEGLAPLIATGNSETVPKLFSRYLSTILHVYKWLCHDPFDPKSPAFRSLRVVRGMHRQVGNKMNMRSGRVADGKTKLWVSQYSMTRTQFAFMGLMAVFPKQLGFVRFTPADFHAIYHFWRVIGHCIGIEDRFNLCQGSDEEIVEMCRLMYNEEWVPVLRENCNGTGANMGKGVLLALHRVIPTIKFNPYLRYAAPFFQLNPENYPLRTWSEKYTYWKFTWTPIIFRSLWFNQLASRRARARMKRAIKERDTYQRRLKDKYPDLNYNDDSICPFHLNNFEYTETLNGKVDLNQNGA